MVKKLFLLLTSIAVIGHSAPTAIRELKLTGTADAGGHAITNLADGAKASDAATIGQLDAKGTAVLGEAKGYTDQKINQIPPVIESDPVAMGALEDHLGDKGNPHEVTPEQIGALRVESDPVALPLIKAVATAGTNYTDAAIQAIPPVAMTNWQASVNALTNGAALGATALQPSWATTGTVFRATEVTGAQSTLIATAWQNPASAVDWTWTSNGREITLTGYSGPNAVVIPDMLDGLPVTVFGGIFIGNMDITSIGGGANIKAVGDYAFEYCAALNSVSMPACTTVGDNAFAYCADLNSVSLPACATVGDYAFYNCGNLNSVSMPACTTVGDYAFYNCGNLNSVSLPACTTVGDSAFANCGNLNSISLPACTTVGSYAFYGCENLSSVTFGQNEPAQTANVFEDSTPTIYVSNPHATGWGDTWNGRPVVRAASMADIPTLPGPGCTELDYAADGTSVTITGATYSYFFAPDKAYTLSVAPDAPRYHYSIEIIGDHACTLPAGHRLRGEWTPTGTNVVVVTPGTGTVWNVFGRGL